MHRVLSTVALAGWFGFLAVSAFAALPSTQSAEADAAGAGAGTSLVFLDLPTAMTLMALLGSVVLLGSALVRLHQPSLSRPGGRCGVVLGAAGLLLVGLVAVLAPVAGVDPFLVDEATAGFWTLLLASVAALWFDQRIAVDGTAEDDEEFDAAMTVIAQSMARQTRLYTEPWQRHTDRRR